jgi:leader peptidase (prepilin peptidase)/N-methyltransferase
MPGAWFAENGSSGRFIKIWQEMHALIEYHTYPLGMTDMTMQWIIWFGAAALGAVIGSFLNVCIHRLPRNESIVYPASHCPRCGAPIKWYDNIPIVSYVVLRGRCRRCRDGISVRYPLVELASAAFCFLLVYRYGPTVSAGVYYAFACALIVVTFVDLDYYIIPNVITYCGIPLGLAASFVIPEVTVRDAFIGAALGGGLLFTVALLFEWIRKKEGMGFGDVKLLAMIGAFLGWKGVILTVVVSSFVGAVVGYAALKLSKKGLEHPIPYGPFLALGGLLYLFGGSGWVNWYLRLGG